MNLIENLNLSEYEILQIVKEWYLKGYEPDIFQSEYGEELDERCDNSIYEIYKNYKDINFDETEIQKGSFDVDNITDIPNIESFFNEIFRFELYEKGDDLTIYTCNLPCESVVNIEIHSDEKLINKTIKLWDLITQENIGYFSWSIYNFNEEKVKGYVYRPLVDKKNKIYG